MSDMKHNRQRGSQTLVVRPTKVTLSYIKDVRLSYYIGSIIPRLPTALLLGFVYESAFNQEGTK